MALRVARGLAHLAPDYAASVLHTPLFVIGCGRSGSTLLRRTLARHHELAVLPSEGNELWHPALYPWNGSRRDVPPLWVDPEEFTRASSRGRDAGDVRRLKAVFGAYRRVRRGLRRRVRFVNKTEMIHFMLPQVVRWFPDARFVHLVRDGRGVALSRARRLLDPSAPKLDLPPGIPDLTDLDGLLEISMTYWQRSLDALDEAAAALALGSTRLRELTYEELCARPREALASLANFLGVDPEPFATLDPGSFSNRNHKYRQELSRDRIARLSELGRRGLESRGYLAGGAA